MSIPPIEIGSFAAPRPDKSDFIGSASGAFFVNTVFRAFAAAAASFDGEHNDHAAANTPAPGSAHIYLAADESTHAQGPGDDTFVRGDSIREEMDTPDFRSYGVTVPALGRPPPPTAVKQLIMLYFRNWHPFFPFLHGPSFLEEVDHFYHKGFGPDGNANSPPNLRSKLCRAVTFQCVFNLASLGGDSVHLDMESRIQSAAALTGLLGAICGSHDISALQALLAAELYLTSTMSLRAASTVHGALTRILYHSGFHRCPFRFVQLPRAMYDIRKRIFWCAYVLDRYLSQSLGYPVAIRDDEVDVCIPGMAELHRPVKPRKHTSPSHGSIGDEVLDHLPRERSGPGQAESEPGLQSNGDRATEVGDPDTHRPPHHGKCSTDAAGEYVLGYLVTYSRLVGVSLDLFHKSIHKRVITQDKVLEITYRTHAWWNSLPLALQDDLESHTASPSPQFGAFFAMLYHHLIIINNRPFLSLPTRRVDFRSCLQSALSASRSILRLRVRRLEAPLLLAWPGMLSATWMAGLVVAFASLLALYPQEKAIADLDNCLALLDDMSCTWASARSCHAGIQALANRLALRSGHIHPSLSLGSMSTGPYDDNQDGTARWTSPLSSHQDDTNEKNSSNKRRRLNGDIGTYVSHLPHGQVDVPNCSVGVDLSDAQDWQPVLEYTGPDFGFDAEQFASRGEWQTLPSSMEQESMPLFSNAGFEAYIQHFGDRLSF